MRKFIVTIMLLYTPLILGAFVFSISLALFISLTVNAFNLVSKDIDLVEKETNNIITSANKIHSSIEHIRSSYIRSIERKLETYTPKLNKLLKNIDE